MQPDDPTTTAAPHGVKVWRDEYGEWVWDCTCSPDLHGGYASAGNASRDAAIHQTEARSA